MENKEKKSKLGKFVSIFLPVIVIILIVMGVAIYYNWKNKVIDVFSDKEQIEQPVEIDIPTYTVEDIVNLRKEEKEICYLDSVYMHMPDVALIAILIKNGTDLSRLDIAKEYLKNKKSYDDVEFGAQINDMYKQSGKEPDILPDKAPVDTVENKLSTSLDQEQKPFSVFI